MLPRTTVVNRKRTQAYDIYIGRPSKWGNPFRATHGRSRAEAIAAYEAYLLGQPALLADLHELQGKVLGCWCAPLPCHGDVLARLADQLAADAEDDEYHADLAAQDNAAREGFPDTLGEDH